MVKEPGMTTIRISEETVAFLKSEGRYEENLAIIVERLLNELKTLRKKTPAHGGQ